MNQSPYMRAYEAGIKLAQLEYLSKQAKPKVRPPAKDYVKHTPIEHADPSSDRSTHIEHKKNLKHDEGVAMRPKTALLTRILKPISNSYQGRALADRIAPLGWRRIGSELGHFTGDLGSGAGVAALLGGGADDMALSGLGSALIGKQLNQVRANKYLNKALAGPNKLSKSDLNYLRGEMGDFSTYLGADSLHELFGGISARKRVDDAIKRKLF